MHYFLAYPDDFVQNVTVHDNESRLTVETFRQTLLIVFAYNQAEGALEMYAKRLHKPVKEKLERIFAGAILHWELDGFDPDAAYELDQLKDAFFDLRTDPADRISVRIRKMRLSSTNSGRRILIEVDDDDPDDHIHKAIEECINLDNAPLSEWHATLVTFCLLQCWESHHRITHEWLPLLSSAEGWPAARSLTTSENRENVSGSTGD